MLGEKDALPQWLMHQETGVVHPTLDGITPSCTIASDNGQAVSSEREFFDPRKRIFVILFAWGPSAIQKGSKKFFILDKKGSFFSNTTHSKRIKKIIYFRSKKFFFLKYHPW